MKTVKEGRLGKFTLRIVRSSKGLQGFAFKDARNQSAIMDGEEIEELWDRLVTEVSKQSAEYVGYDGAMARFLRIFPDGFSDQRYLAKERDYKLAAIKRLNGDAPLDAALNGEVDPALVERSSTNLFYKSEKIAFGDILRSQKGAAFVQAAASMATGSLAEGLSGMSTIANAIDRKSWPVVTYLPFLWKPENHMFLKPMTATGFAERVGHRLAHEYSSEIKPSVYESLLDLTAETRSAISKLGPVDNIDVQSFIFVVAKYTDDDVA